MFYNTKALVAEKVLQQYYFECFMQADARALLSLLPATFHSYCRKRAIKGLRPEFPLPRPKGFARHITDFTIVPMPDSRLGQLNVEVKWNAADFLRESGKRQSYYNGECGRGFIVALDPSSAVARPDQVAGVPIVYLSSERFASWFQVNAGIIIAQALSRRTRRPARRVTGPKYWLVHLADKPARKHYFDAGRKHRIWAFKDSRRTPDALLLLDGDYVVFVMTTGAARDVWPPHSKRGGNWSVTFAESVRLSKGFHVNYTNKRPYGVFEPPVAALTPMTKDYTQFVRFATPDGDPWVYRSPTGLSLGKSLFGGKQLADIVEAMRRSLCRSGNPIGLTEDAYRLFRQLVRSAAG